MCDAAAGHQGKPGPSQTPRAGAALTIVCKAPRSCCLGRPGPMSPQQNKTDSAPAKMEPASGPVQVYAGSGDRECTFAMQTRLLGGLSGQRGCTEVEHFVSWPLEAIPAACAVPNTPRPTHALLRLTKAAAGDLLGGARVRCNSCQHYSAAAAQVVLRATLTPDGLFQGSRGVAGHTVALARTKCVPAG